jgi:DNA polymerase-3 subunit delta
MKFGEFVSAAKQQDGKSVFVFHGDEQFFKDEGLRVLRREVLPVNTDSIHVKFADAGEAALAGELQSAPFFHKKKLVLVEDGDAVLEQAIETVKGHASAPSKVVLVLMTKLIGDASRKLKPVSDNVAFVECRGMRRENDVKPWIVERASAHGKRISTRAAQELFARIGPELGILDAHLQKLALFTGARQSIEFEDIEGLVEPDRDYEAFQLTDAIVMGNPKQAMTILRAKMDKGDAGEKVLGLVAWYYRRLVKAKEVCDRGGKEADIVRELALRPNQEFLAGRLMAQARSRSWDEIGRLFRILSETDKAIKTGAMPPEVACETAVLKLMGAK